MHVAFSTATRGTFHENMFTGQSRGHTLTTAYCFLGVLGTSVDGSYMTCLLYVWGFEA